MYRYVKQFVMALPAMFLGDWFYLSRKGGGVGWYGCVCENPSVGPFLLFSVQMDLGNSHLTS